MSDNGSVPDEFLAVPGVESMTIDQIIASARPAEAIVRLCLRGDLNGEIARLEVELAEVRDRARRGVPADDDEAGLNGEDVSGRDVALAGRIEELRVEMGKHLHTFTMRALPSDDFAALDKRHNPNGLKRDVEGMAPELIAQSCASPVMTPQQVLQLFGVLNAGQRDQLFAAAWSVNTGSVDIPKSPLSLAVLRRQGFSGS